MDRARGHGPAQFLRRARLIGRKKRRGEIGIGRRGGLEQPAHDRAMAPGRASNGIKSPGVSERPSKRYTSICFRYEHCRKTRFSSALHTAPWHQRPVLVSATGVSIAPSTR